MVVVIDENNIIRGYATVGGIVGGIEIEAEEAPEDLCAGYYKLINGEIVLDEELKAQTETTHLDKNVT